LTELRSKLGRDALPASVPGVPRGLPGQLVRFAAIGVASTLAYMVLYVLLRGMAGAYVANLLALVITAIGNTAANRRLTFGVRGAAGAATHHVQGLIVFGLGLALTTGALAALHAWMPDASSAVELLVLVVANALATVLRFVAYRSWIFRKHTADRAEPARQESLA
jgi:putative flippase GtrA